MKISKYLRTFFAEPDDAAGGGIADLVDTQDDGNLGGEPDAPQTPEPVAPAAPQIDYSKFTDAIKNAFPQPQQKQEPQLSPDEVKKLLKDWEPDDAFMEEFGNIATQKGAIKKLFKFAADHAEARAQVHTYGEVQRLQQAFAPQLAAVQEFAAQQRENRFNTKYPDLAKPELRPVIGAIAQQVLATQKFADEDSAFDAVAKGVERVIQSTTPTFKLTTKAKPSANPNELPTQSAGSGGGGGEPTPRAKKGPPGLELFTNLAP